MGWAGDEEAEQRFGFKLFQASTIAADSGRNTIRAEIESQFKASLLEMDSDVSLYRLMAWWSPEAAKALMFLVVPAPDRGARSVFVDDRSNVEMIGTPEAKKLARCSLRTLGFGDFRNVGMEEAKVVASKVISDVSAETDDVGEPAHIFGVTRDGVAELDEQDLQAVASSATAWTMSLRATLAREATPSETTTRDEGLRPPE